MAKEEVKIYWLQ